MLEMDNIIDLIIFPMGHMLRRTEVMKLKLALLTLLKLQIDFKQTSLTSKSDRVVIRYISYNILCLLKTHER